MPPPVLLPPRKEPEEEPREIPVDEVVNPSGDSVIHSGGLKITITNSKRDLQPGEVSIGARSCYFPPGPPDPDRALEMGGSSIVIKSTPPDPLANGAAVRKAKMVADLQGKYSPEQIKAELRRRGLDEKGQPLPKKPGKRYQSTAVGSNYQQSQAAKARRERKKQRKHRRGK